jgi:hypothetical protein
MNVNDTATGSEGITFPMAPMAYVDGPGDAATFSGG